MKTRRHTPWQSSAGVARGSKCALGVQVERVRVRLLRLVRPEGVALVVCTGHAREASWQVEGTSRSRFGRAGARTGMAMAHQALHLGTLEFALQSGSRTAEDRFLRPYHA